ncbi:alpha-ketoglutarate-dependent dioxygenase AlkB [Pseudonocardia sp. HH130630-07]|uniref:alpha-ketoglutarate-dependent dioxygenase AlkB n=1 Tax=Pseudonocardia sp. HH130630-07 TaxID=1690815 RepID=UPI000814D599|nr:alpha-ketoglutarate-dependent dioxygenase AlkB [Pseudonocardia sp. HH130630-07]ANY05443.1 DNA repair protein [Pseudonocardia sp. HH130630-07]
MDACWQGSLFETVGADEREPAPVFRHELAHGAWVDVAPGWVPAPAAVFDHLRRTVPFRGHRRRMYDRVVDEPRLTHRWVLPDPAVPDRLLAMGRELGERYGRAFTQIGVNLYRDGSDGVAWHGDRVARERPEAVVALVALGATRPLRLRPTGGGASVSFPLASGDLLVMGGSCQRTWQHSVPKVTASGPRISVQFRHLYPGAPGIPPVGASA